MMDKKTVKHFDDYGFGFQVRILHAPLVKIRGEWILDIDPKRFQRSLLASLATKPVRLTGNEIRFIRLALEMTLSKFGQKFDVSHAAVIKWEKSGNRGTGMSWSTEKDIRLFIASRIQPKPSEFVAVYKKLEEKAENTAMLTEIDGRKAA